ncbi:MAG: metal-dependent hydrolase [Bacillota bacterium]|nr:metal-dependent hydrolase [Bacillota bacterium]
MIFFGHVGLTTAAVKTYENIVLKKKEGRNLPHIDYRAVMIGSILPDIIDKPIGAFFFRSTFHNSRIIAHSLLFSMTLVILGIYRINKYNKSNLFLLGISSVIHQILDSMWDFPGTFYWPVLGLKFPQRPEGDWLNESLTKLMTKPGTFIPELIGLAIVAYYLYKAYKKGRLKDFFKHGIL